MSEKLREYGIPSSVGEELIADIFGKHAGSSYYEGLVDFVSVSQFHECLDRCKEVWIVREAPFAPPSAP